MARYNWSYCYSVTEASLRIEAIDLYTVLISNWFFLADCSWTRPKKKKQTSYFWGNERKMYFHFLSNYRCTAVFFNHMNVWFEPLGKGLFLFWLCVLSSPPPCRCLLKKLHFLFEWRSRKWNPILNCLRKLLLTFSRLCAQKTPWKDSFWAFGY